MGEQISNWLIGGFTMGGIQFQNWMVLILVMVVGYAAYLVITSRRSR
jgi:hypothetical protein